MIHIPKEELFESLKHGYIEYKNGVANGIDEIDLADIKGFCTTIEQISSAYGNVTHEEIVGIKNLYLEMFLLEERIKVINLVVLVNFGTGLHGCFSLEFSN